MLPKTNCTIICDDIRWEVNNKTALLGVYSDRILFMKLPARLPKLCFFTRVEGGTGDHDFSFELLDPDGRRMDGAHGEGQMKLAEDTEGTRAHFAVCIGNVTFEKLGSYRYLVTLTGSEHPFIDYPFNIAVDPSVFAK
jgi:hypothetical protein